MKISYSYHFTLKLSTEIAIREQNKLLTVARVGLDVIFQKLVLRVSSGFQTRETFDAASWFYRELKHARF